jgi:carotenoid cleavage dioxygenase
MLSRRRFLTLAGFAGVPLLGGPLLTACGSDELLRPSTTGAGPDPLPDDPNKPWWLRKDYAPVSESEAVDLEVIGALPPTLSGLYVRNGPNPKSGDSAHWFLGDGMVHAVELTTKKALSYRARYVETAVLGTTDDTPGPPGLTDHQANTSVLWHAGRLLCLEEIGIPYEISPFDLSTKGTFDFAGLLATPMTAHPKIDPATGELLFFGYGILEASLTFHRVDARGALVQSEKIALPKAIMMHDFQITPTHVVFMDLPIVFDLDMAIAGEGFPYRWAPENGARLGVMPRAGGAADVRWIEIDPCYVFHTWNAFHDQDDAGIIHLDAIRYPTMWSHGASDFSTDGRAHRFSIDAAAGKVKLAALDDAFVEMPRINRSFQGKAYRYGYAVGTHLLPPPGELSPPNQIVKYDHHTGARQIHQLVSGQEADEALFVPEPGAAAEDDGWLLAYVFDHADNRSELLVLDATDVTGPPVARVKLPHRVPHGFHGEFIPAG